MRRKKRSVRATPASRAPDVLGCFDDDLRIHRHLFDDAASVCDIAVGCPPVVQPGYPTMLRFGEHAVDLSGVLDWLTPLEECGGWTYYVHDHIVVELSRLEPYQRERFDAAHCSPGRVLRG